MFMELNKAGNANTTERLAQNSMSSAGSIVSSHSLLTMNL